MIIFHDIYVWNSQRIKNEIQKKANIVGALYGIPAQSVWGLGELKIHPEFCVLGKHCTVSSLNTMSVLSFSFYGNLSTYTILNLKKNSKMTLARCTI